MSQVGHVRRLWDGWGLSGRVHRPLALGVLAFGLLAVGQPHPVVGQTPATPGSVRVSQEVLSRGGGRVLVRLRMPVGRHIPEGSLQGHPAVARQRADIAAVQGQVAGRLRGKAHRVLRRYQTVPLLAVEIGPDGLAELAALPGQIESITEDRLRSPLLAESGPLIGADQAWDNGFDGTGTVIAIVDTGVDKNHPFLQNGLQSKVVDEACYSDAGGLSISAETLCPNGQPEQIEAGAAQPCDFGTCWHGTHVAGIAAGNGAGASVPYSGIARGANLIAIQVFSKFPSSASCGAEPAPCIRAWDSDIIAGLERVYELRDTYSIAAVNLSLGGGAFTCQDPLDPNCLNPCDLEPHKLVIDNLRLAGIATIIAAGNGGHVDALASPACISSAVSVASTNLVDAVTQFSDVAPFLSLLAPGKNVTSSAGPPITPPSTFTSASGTSMAAPLVAGAWSVLRQAAPDANVDQILAALQSTGLPVTDTRAGGIATIPRVQVAAALATVPTIQALRSVVGGLVLPVAITHAGDGRLFITEQCGTIRIFDGTALLPTPFLDLSANVSCDGERGLLSVAFHPNYATNGFFYVYFTNLAGKIVVKRFQVSSNPDVADPSSGVHVLKIAHPTHNNHYGGQLQFGPGDGHLYVSVGDGGGIGDPGNNAQNLGVHLGKLLRLDPSTAPTCGGGGPPCYTIPASNPFVGVPGALPEIWAFGLRNPWRFSFDRNPPHDLYLGDVGQGSWEEINHQPAGVGGQNYGWRLMEGLACFNPATGCDTGTLTLPVLQYPHIGDKCAVVGGYRYRGSAVPELAGQYLFGDACQAKVWVASPGTPWTKTKLLVWPLSISAFGEDQAGEIYVADRAGGFVYHIVPAP